MNYRYYITEDLEQIEKLCDKHKIEVPKQSMVFVADNGKIHGFIGIKGEVFIEPLISENPLVTGNLFNKVIKHLKQRGVKKVRCICDSQNSKLFEKIGFNIIENDKVIMERRI